MKKRVALVTGGGRGLGEYIARRLHARGFKVAVADILEEDANRVAVSLDASGETSAALHLDVRSKADFEGARDSLATRWGGTDVLINNAAITRAVALMEITQEKFDEGSAVTLRGTLFGVPRLGATCAVR